MAGFATRQVVSGNDFSAIFALHLLLTPRMAGDTPERYRGSRVGVMLEAGLSGRLVIVGAGQAAFALAAKLRSCGDTRPITMIGAEPVLPYQRPPLSKKYLLGEMSFDRLQFRPDAWYGENNIEFVTGCRVTAIDRAARTVSTDRGDTFSWETLALTTGATPRRLPASIGGDLGGVFTVRNKADADLLAAEMRPGRRLLVVGGGYIGLEAAAVARNLGLEVTLIETAPRILQRVASRETADIVRGIHAARGVTIREETGLLQLSGENGHVQRAELSDGTVIDVDIVIAGIGVTADDDLARQAGLEVNGGIIVDEFARTSDPQIYAAGDCTVLPWRGLRVRLESVQNAVDQAEAAAINMTGAAVAYDPHPWFWSDQYDMKLQIAGFNAGYDRTIVRPGQREGAVSVWYFRDEKFVAVDAVNDAKAYVTGKKLLEMRREPVLSVLQDASADLKQLIL